MKSTKINFKFFLYLVLILCICMTSVKSFALETYDSYKQEIERFICNLENKSNVSVTYLDDLYNPNNDSVIAKLYTLENGYAIIGAQSFQIFEYSLDASNPYKDTIGRKYYAGYFRYFDKDLNHVYTGTEFLNDSEAADFLDQETMSTRNVNTATRAANSTTRRYLSGSLSTDWVNGYCGPTSAYNMLRYMGYIPSKYYGTTGIYYLNSFMNPTGGQGVSLTTLKNGINAYMNYQGYSARVKSNSYSFYLVQNCINADEPITLGTNGGGLTSEGHVQTIHGYAIVEGSSTTYILYVNNSWGSNNVAITYTGSAPSYLKDHVYF